MSSPAWLDLNRALADTGVFIDWYRGEPKAKLFFRNPNIEIYYSRVTAQGIAALADQRRGAKTNVIDVRKLETG